jgi:DNA-binding MarR family transcriptional regulator
MSGTTEHGEADRDRIMLGLLESVERGGEQSQRRLASELGIALGLVNAYLKRCITKGLVKVTHAPARRYAYYLTPQGFAEKSRLTIAFLSDSFTLFRRARADYAEIMRIARGRGFNRVALAGASDLAEIATLCAIEGGTEILAVVDANCKHSHFVGVPVLPSFELIADAFDGVVITDLTGAVETFSQAVQRFGAERVLAPAFLGLTDREGQLEIAS